MENYDLQVLNPVNLNPVISAKINRLEGRYNFKPYIGKLPNGDISCLLHTPILKNASQPILLKILPGQ